MFSFCRPVSSKKRFLPHRVLNADFTFTLFENAAHILQADWDVVTAGRTIFLEKEYLEIIEHGTYNKLTCRYVIVYKHNKPCGIIYFQVVDFKAAVFGDLMTRQVDNIRSKKMNLFEKYIDSNKEEVLLRLFTCGNNLVSGAYGFLFNKSVTAEEGHELLLEIIDLVAKEEKLRGTISAVLIKDFYKPLGPGSLFKEERYSEFFVEPNLIVEIPAAVRSVEDYISLFSKKYRNRAKSVFKSLAGVEIKYLDLEAIRSNESAMYRLYEQIFDKARFRLIKLPTHYFSEVKQRFDKSFTVKGYFLEGTLIAFASSFCMPDGSLEAHYIGFDYELNTRYSLYQNILYSMIAEAIRHGCGKVNLGRTASEIKTTVGARPQNLICYIKPQNTISKLLQKPFISSLQPAPWVQRNPFKEEDHENKSQENKATPESLN